MIGKDGLSFKGQWCIFERPYPCGRQSLDHLPEATRSVTCGVDAEFFCHERDAQVWHLLPQPQSRCQTHNASSQDTDLAADHTGFRTPELLLAQKMLLVAVFANLQGLLLAWISQNADRSWTDLS